MRRFRHIEGGLWAAAALLVAVATTRTAQSADGTPTNGDFWDQVSTMDLPDRFGSPPAIGGAGARNPFRFRDMPAEALIEEPAPPEGFAIPEEPPPRPHLTLAGLVGGPPWEALVEGVPGTTGTVLVHVGQELGELRVVSITPDTTVIESPDTTWRLAMKREWQ